MVWGGKWRMGKCAVVDKVVKEDEIELWVKMWAAILKWDWDGGGGLNG